MRWERRASSISRVLKVVWLAGTTIALFYLFRLNDPAVLVIIGGVMLAWAIYLLSRSRGQVLVVDETRVRWGALGLHSDDDSVNFKFLTAVRFLERANGTGSIEFILEYGGHKLAPSEFTDQPGVAVEILTALKRVAPNVEITVH
jgi:hypothetical protein